MSKIPPLPPKLGKALDAIGGTEELIKVEVSGDKANRRVGPGGFLFKREAGKAYIFGIRARRFDSK